MEHADKEEDSLIMSASAVTNTNENEGNGNVMIASPHGNEHEKLTSEVSAASPCASLSAEQTKASYKTTNEAFDDDSTRDGCQLLKGNSDENHDQLRRERPPDKVIGLPGVLLQPVENNNGDVQHKHGPYEKVIGLPRVHARFQDDVEQKTRPSVDEIQHNQAHSRVAMARPGATHIDGPGAREPPNQRSDNNVRDQGVGEDPPFIATVVGAFLVDEDQENAYRREREDELSREFTNQAYEELARELPRGVQVIPNQQQEEQDCATAASSGQSNSKWQDFVRFVEIATIVGGVVSIIIVLVLHITGEDDFSSTRKERLMNVLFPISGGSLKNTSSPRGEAFRWLMYEDPMQLDVIQGGVAESVVIERYVVVLFFLVTGGPTEWINKLGFLGNTSVCDWFNDDLQKGVRCHKAKGSIYHIRMEKNDLNGTLPEELSALQDLQDLLISRNRLYGSLPVTLSKNRRLQVLEIDFNDFSGTIPDLSGLRDLEVVSLAFNRLNGPLPSWLASVPNLYHLIVGGNLLTGTVPTFRQLDLEALVLAGNLLEGTIPESLGFSSLEWIWLHQNFLTGTIPRSIGRLGRLQRLRLDQNSLTGSIPTELGLLESLVRLRLNENRLTGILPTELGRLRKLSQFLVRSNVLSGTIPFELAGLNGLLDLSLKNNSLTGNVTRECCGLGDTMLGFCKLQVFEADCTGDPAPEIICPCCTTCCNDETGRCEAMRSPQEKCVERKMHIETMYAERNTQCECNEDGTISCSDLGCMHCDQDESICYVDAEPGIEFSVVGGDLDYVAMSVQYVRGRDERVAFKKILGNIDNCEGSINNKVCASCLRTSCPDGFITFILDCSNLGYGVRSACETGDDPFKMLWDTINQLDRVSDVPIRGDCVRYNASHVGE